MEPLPGKAIPSGNREELRIWMYFFQPMKEVNKACREFPLYPRAGVGAVVFKGESILLIKRGQEPNKGLWTVPGGLIQLGEYSRDAIIQEIREECSIDINLLNVIDCFDFIDIATSKKIKYHYIVLEFLAEYMAGDVKAQSDAQSADWFSLDQIKNLHTTQKTLDLVTKAFKEYKSLTI